MKTTFISFVHRFFAFYDSVTGSLCPAIELQSRHSCKLFCIICHHSQIQCPRVCGAISMSFGPIVVPFFSSPDRMSPYSTAASSSNGSTAMLDRNEASASWFFSGLLLLLIPYCISASVIAEIQNSVFF